MLCLTTAQVTALKPKLKEVGGKKLVEMSSQDRLDFFAEATGNKVVGEFITASFEKAMVSKQKNALKKWAEKSFNQQEKKDPTYFAVLKKIDNMSERGVLSPNHLGNYLDTLISTQLGVDVKAEEIQKINELSGKIKETKNILADDVNNREKRIAYGNAILDTYDYVQTIAPTKNSMLADIANLPKSIMSTLDFSAPFRQGWGMMSRPEFYKAFASMLKFGFDEKSYRDLQADIISRPTYNLMKKSGLRISILADKLTQREEQFMSTLIDKLPIPDRANFLKGSERAYTGFLSKLRADVFDHLVHSAELVGEDINPNGQVIKDIAAVVNDFTGSGNIGINDKLSGAVPLLNATLFSPRKISAMVNMMNPERYVNPKTSATARKAALRNLIGSVSITVGILALYNAFANKDNKVETDPRSADFGKIKIGNTRIDVTGGNGTYAVLLARLARNQTKSTTDDSITTLGEGNKPKTRKTIFGEYVNNKLSPTASLFSDWLGGKDSSGNPFNIKSEIASRFMPLIISDFISLASQGDNKITAIGTAADLFGFGTQVYSQTALTPAQAAKKDAQDKKDAAIKAQIEKKYGVDNKEVNNIISTLSDHHLATSAQKAGFVADIIGYQNKKVAADYTNHYVIPVAVYKEYIKLKSANDKVSVSEGTHSKGDLLSTIVTYANAIGTDPETAFNRIFTGQVIRRVDNGAIIVERMSLADSEAVKKEDGSVGNMRLDHTVPLELGGSNSKDNLNLVSNAEWASYTPVENFLGKNLKSGKIDKSTAQDLITKFKKKELNAQQVYDTVNKK